MLRSNPVNPDSRVEKEANALSKDGYSVTVLGWDRSEDYSIRKEVLHLYDGNAAIYRVGIKAGYSNGMKNLKELVRFQIAIIRFVRKNYKKYDVIHSCDFDTAYAAFHSIPHDGSIKFVYDIFDYYVDAFAVPTIIKPIILKSDRSIINQSDAVIICTEERRKQIAGSKPRRVVVIHNTPPKLINDDSIQTQHIVQRVKVAYFGILSYGRLIEELLDIISKNNRFELHIGGFGIIEDKVREYSERYSNIVFYGRTPYDKVLKIENECNIMTAIYDPTIANHLYAAPNKFYESLMLGKPLIMVEKTGMSEVIEQYHIGEIIEYSSEGLRNGLNALADRADEWPQIAIEMKKIYEQYYSWNKMEDRLIALYQKLLFD
jgi:glycosyltransferase involved in cell wall biosynthesis